MGVIGELFALPEHCAILLVQSDQRSFPAPRRDYHLIPIHECRFRIAPGRRLPAKIFRKIFAPMFLAGGCFETNHFAGLPDHKKHLSIDRRCAAWPIESARRAGPADLAGPYRRSISNVEREHEAAVLLL